MKRYSIGSRMCVAGFLTFVMVFTCALHTNATTVRPPEFSTLVNESDYIVHARVVSVRSNLDSPGSRKIHTFVELEVLKVIAGRPPTRPILRFLGGQVGQQRLLVEGTPEFSVGDEDVLFVRGNGRSICPLYAMGHGRYAIKSESVGTRSKRVRRGALKELNAAEGTSLRASETPESIDLSEFIERIQKEVQPGARITGANRE